MLIIVYPIVGLASRKNTHPNMLRITNQDIFPLFFSFLTFLS